VSYIRRSISDPNFMFPGWCASLDPACDANGTLATLYILANAWFHPFDMGRISPYIGVGAGVARLMPDISLYEGGGEPPGLWSWDNRDFAPAVQLGAGATFAVNDRITIDASYRLRAVLGGTFEDSVDPCNGGACEVTDVRYLDQGLQLGITFG